MKKALIFGATGQDGSYLCELLLEKGYQVFGSMRRSSSFNTARIDHILDRLNMFYADLSDSSSIAQIFAKAAPDEVYALGAQSHVRTSFDLPLYTADVTGLGSLRLFEAIRMSGQNPRIYQASSSEMFGAAPAPQSETTPFYPKSPYGISKLFSHWAAVNYRESYGMHISNGILFNHESPRRTETFVTQKIVKAAVRIHRGEQNKLRLGNLDAKRDWGYAPDYVEAMWLMLQQPEPGDYVIATGETHTVREFLKETFQYLGLDWERYVVTEPRYFRPTEVDLLLGDASKAKRVLGWEPKVKFHELVRIMVDAEVEKGKK
jgi:GDPmannose 4,6-dehydratase